VLPETINCDDQRVPHLSGSRLNKDEVVATASRVIFGKPLVTNVYRSIVVEAMVAAVLPEWEWCSADYMSYDFVHPNGTRLEVKQSAMKQTWQTRNAPRPSWDIAPRTGFWENGTDWIARPGRNADIYILGLHDVVDATADHRDASQWRFFVIPVSQLPSTKRISLSTARSIADPWGIERLQEAVAAASAELGLNAAGQIGA